ncbi:MAG: hypothetical protein KatS3mg023_0471 [Armatimonadota bacterium]|nr:MAG: hypothetical protein KatS3mg023_0471 [Armatimonadota bacterium]
MEQRTLKTLLEGNPAYSDRIAEQVLAQYLRIHTGYVNYLVLKLGIPPEDVEQELRIALWRQWTRYNPDSKVSLQQWLSWRIRHHFKSIMRTYLHRRLPTVSLESIIEDYNAKE